MSRHAPAGYLDRKNRFIADRLHQQGTVCHTPVYPREICIRRLELQASAIIAPHAHPSGDPEPSRADIDMTRRIQSALKTIEVTLLDHVVVTPSGSVRFQDRSLLWAPPQPLRLTRRPDHPHRRSAP